MTISNALDNFWMFLLTKLNVIASLMLAYAVATPNAVMEMVSYIPVQLRPFTPLLAFGWFCLVQYAQHRDIRKVS